MDQLKKTQGNFVAFLNRQETPDDNKPTFDGRLTAPGIDNELHFAL